MEKVSDSLRDILNKKWDCFTVDEAKTIEEATIYLSAYEESGLPPTAALKTVLEENAFAEAFRDMAGSIRRLYWEIDALMRIVDGDEDGSDGVNLLEDYMKYKKAQKRGRLLILPTSYYGDCLYKIRSQSGELLDKPQTCVLLEAIAKKKPGSNREGFAFFYKVLTCDSFTGKELCRECFSEDDIGKNVFPEYRDAENEIKKLADEKSGSLDGIDKNDVNVSTESAT